MKSTPVAETRRSAGAPGVGAAGAAAGGGAGAGAVDADCSLQPMEMTANATRNAAVSALDIGRSRPAREAQQEWGGGGKSHNYLRARRGAEAGGERRAGSARRPGTARKGASISGSERALAGGGRIGASGERPRPGRVRAPRPTARAAAPQGAGGYQSRAERPRSGPVSG